MLKQIEESAERSKKHKNLVTQLRNCLENMVSKKLRKLNKKSMRGPLKKDQ
jgi:hypothetical protein